MRLFSRSGSSLRLLACLAAALVAACSDQSPTDPSAPVTGRVIPAPAIAPELSTLPATSICGSVVGAFLTDGTHSPGRIAIGNDAENLYVTFRLSATDWYLAETRLAVTRARLSIPMGDTGPDPWSFPHAQNHDPAVRSHGYTVPLGSIGADAGSKLYISAMAGVVHPLTSDLGGDWEWLATWAVTKGSNIRTYTVAGCGTEPVTPPPPTGILTLTFDDGWLSTYRRAYPALRRWGLRGNVAVYPQPIEGRWEAYMKLRHLQIVSDSGWTIVSHGATHRDLTTLSDAALEFELTHPKQWIAAKGLRTAPVFVVPYHSWGERERARTAPPADRPPPSSLPPGWRPSPRPST
jgi:hypothetical protein